MSSDSQSITTLSFPDPLVLFGSNYHKNHSISHIQAPLQSIPTLQSKLKPSLSIINTLTSTNMQLLCISSTSLSRAARSLRNRLLNSKTLLPARAAAASVRNSIHLSSPFHSHSHGKIKHQVQPAALGTVAVLGNGLPPGIESHSAMMEGQGCARAGKHIGSFYQQWERGSFMVRKSKIM